MTLAGSVGRHRIDVRFEHADEGRVRAVTLPPDLVSHHADRDQIMAAQHDLRIGGLQLLSLRQPFATAASVVTDAILSGS